jgi:hypothetical protein
MLKFLFIVSLNMMIIPFHSLSQDFKKDISLLVSKPRGTTNRISNLNIKRENITKIKFTLSEKQMANGWYLDLIDDEIAKLMHPIYGYLKHVKLTAPEINPHQVMDHSIQIIDIYNIDEVLYSDMFFETDYFPAAGSLGYPVQISDFNHNGLIDFSGAYKLIHNDELAKSCIVEYTTDSKFVLKKVYEDSLTSPRPVTDLNKDGWVELNLLGRNSFNQLRSTMPDYYPDTVSFSYLMWSGGGGQLSSETITDLDNDGKMDLLHVGDDTLGHGKNIYVAEYNMDLDNFEQKFRYSAEDWRTSGFSYGDFDDDGYTEFVTGSIHGNVYIFESSGNDRYNMIHEDTLSTSNAYLTVSTNDIDDNGKIEFFIGGSSYFDGVGGTRFYWFEADGNNSYQKVRSFFVLGINPLSWDEIHKFDVNNDGNDDIVINYTDIVVILTWNNVTEEFEVFYLCYWDHPVHGVTMYDLSKDNHLDLFISVRENESIPSRRTYYYKRMAANAIQSHHEYIPTDFDLMQNYPNPFNNSTTIPFFLNTLSTIDLIIYDIAGKEVKTILKNEVYTSGMHTINWAGDDNKGKEVSSGVYLCIIINGEKTLSRKILLVK